MNRRWLARMLAAGYGPRLRADAAAFIAQALDEEIARAGWIGAARVVRQCVSDILVSRWRPDGLPITAAPITASQLVSNRSSIMDHVLQDVRFGFRHLRQHPAFALAAVLTMALGIGANAAIFSVTWQTLFHPLPYPHSEQLVEIWETFGSDTRINLSMPAKYYDVRRLATSFQTVAAYSAIQSDMDLTGNGEPQQLSVRSVTADYFHVLGMPALLGRTLGAADFDTETAVVVISEGLWHGLFAGRHDVIGQTVRLAGSPAVVVGVMPAAFEERGGRVDLWTPTTLPPESNRLTGHYLRVIARLRPEISMAAADAEMKSIAKRAAAENPKWEGKLSAYVASLVDGRGTTRGDTNVRTALSVLSLAALAVLLIACANLASLQLARSVARAREFGIRSAMGASRWRVVQQLITEGLLISILGAIGGIVLGMWVMRALRTVAPRYVTDASAVDPVVVGYALSLAVISAVVFALAPSWRTATNATRWLRQRSDGGDRGSAILRMVLVSGQIAVALVLLVGAALLISSLARVMRVSPGFNPDGAVAFDVSVPYARYDDYTKQRALFDSLGKRLAELPSVSSVCFLTTVPFTAQGALTYVPDGRTDQQSVPAHPQTVTSGCFDALGLPLVRGRLLAEHEPAPVAVVSAAFAKTAWPDGDPIGQRIHVGIATGPLLEVVGVTADTLSNSLEERFVMPNVYMAWTEEGYAAYMPQHALVRTAVAPASLFTAIKSAVREVDRDQPVANLQTMNSVVGQTTTDRRFTLTLLGGFAGVALILSTIGIYGLLTQIVEQRGREIGIRLALGATPGSVMRLMLNHAALALSIALPLGLGGAFLASRLLKRFMFNMSATDPSIYAAVGVTLAAVVLLASWLPARRAARVDPAASVRG